MADAWEREQQAPRAEPASPKADGRAETKARTRQLALDAAAAKALDKVQEREGLTRTEVKILTVLAQAGRPLSSVQVGIRCGLSSTTGSFAQALASLRESGFIVGKGSGLQITHEGLQALGPFSRLPEGAELFDYWCHKVGGTGTKILIALRARHREHSGPATSAQLGSETGLSHTTGSFAQALATLRKLELIDGGGSSMTLSTEMQRACEITIGVFDTSSGKMVRVDRSGRAVTK